MKSCILRIPYSLNSKCEYAGIDAEIKPTDADLQMWSSRIDGALTKEHSLDSIRRVGFQNVEVLSEQLYLDEEGGNQRNGENKTRITSIVIKAVKE